MPQSKILAMLLTLKKLSKCYRLLLGLIVSLLAMHVLASVDPEAPKTLQSSMTTLPVWANASLSAQLRSIIMSVQAGTEIGYYCLYLFPQMINVLLLVVNFTRSSDTRHKRVVFLFIHVILGYFLYTLPMTLFVYGSFVGYVIALVILLLVLAGRCFQSSLSRKVLLMVHVLGFFEVLYIAMVARLLIYWFTGSK